MRFVSAVSLSVCLEKRGNARSGVGEIFKLDMIRGIHGFIISGEFGRIYFNVNTILPKTTNVNAVFKLRQKVHYRAIPSDNPNSQWRAFIISAVAQD